MTENEILEKVKNDYNKISDHFNITRQKDWGEFEIFKKYILEKNKNSKLKILDIGCGNGRLINFLNDLEIDFEYLGIDNSEEQIKNAMNNVGARCTLQNAIFEVADILDLSKYKNNKFDLILCIATFHHLPSKELRLKALEEIKNILEDDGIIFMTNWNLFQKKYLKYLFINKSILKNKLQDTFIPWKKESGENISNRYYYAFRKNELKNLFLKSGLKILENNFTDNKKILEARNIISILKK